MAPTCIRRKKAIGDGLNSESVMQTEILDLVLDAMLSYTEYSKLRNSTKTPKHYKYIYFKKIRL